MKTIANGLLRLAYTLIVLAGLIIAAQAFVAAPVLVGGALFVYIGVCLVLKALGIRK